jgi:magnesium chelatase accessory protein
MQADPGYRSMGRGNNAPLDWARDGATWPHSACSRFVQAAGLRWHIQQSGVGPPLLLVHGTGASTHSWRALMPLLAQRFTVTACDLPGHGFTAGEPRGGMSLPGISAALAELLRTLALRPHLAVGHSAGAAILTRMCLDGGVAPVGLVSLNGALLPLQPLQAWLFSPVARLLASTSLTARVFAWFARDRAAVERLVASTGSRLDASGVELYWRLVRSPGHVDGALRMMAHWDLERLALDLPGLRVPLTLVVGMADRTLPPAVAMRVHDLLPQSRVQRLDHLGHLAHEERAAQVAEIIFSVAGCPPPDDRAG